MNQVQYLRRKTESTSLKRREVTLSAECRMQSAELLSCAIRDERRVSRAESRETKDKGQKSKDKG